MLRACLADPTVARIVLVLRTPVPDTDPRIVSIIPHLHAALVDIAVGKFHDGC